MPSHAYWYVLPFQLPHADMMIILVEGFRTRHLLFGDVTEGEGKQLLFGDVRHLLFGDVRDSGLSLYFKMCPLFF
jgi:hypothetical protein